MATDIKKTTTSNESASSASSASVGSNETSTVKKTTQKNNKQRTNQTSKNATPIETANTIVLNFVNGDRKFYFSRRKNESCFDPNRSKQLFNTKNITTGTEIICNHSTLYKIPINNVTFKPTTRIVLNKIYNTVLTAHDIEDDYIIVSINIDFLKLKDHCEIGFLVGS